MQTAFARRLAGRARPRAPAAHGACGAPRAPRPPARAARRKAERGGARLWLVLDRRLRMGLSSASGVSWGADRWGVLLVSV